MRVSQLNTTNEVISQIDRLNRRQLVLQQKVATGLEIQRPSDNPASASSVVKIDTERRAAIQLRKNLQEAESTLQVGTRNLEAFQDLITRSREIIALSGGASSPERMQTYAREIEGIVEQAVNLGNTSYRGKSLFGGQAIDSPPFSSLRDANGRITSVSYLGSSDATTLQIGADFAVDTRLPGSSAAGFVPIIEGLIQVRDALFAADPDALRLAQDPLAAGEDHVLLAQAELNGDLARIEWIRLREDNRFLTLEEDRSLAADADLAEVITQLNQAGVAYQAALQTSAQLLSTSLLNFLS